MISNACPDNCWTGREKLAIPGGTAWNSPSRPVPLTIADVRGCVVSSLAHLWAKRLPPARVRQHPVFPTPTLHLLQSLDSSPLQALFDLQPVEPLETRIPALQTWSGIVALLLATDKEAPSLGCVPLFSFFLLYREISCHSLHHIPRAAAYYNYFPSRLSALNKP